MIDELTGSNRGHFLVTTASGSTYLIHIDDIGTRMQRTPADFSISEAWAPSLYRDGEFVPCEIVRLKVGQRGAFGFIKPERQFSRTGYFGSVRNTTVVVAIARIDGDPDLLPTNGPN